MALRKTAVSAVIQKLKVRVWASIRVCRIICVPSAQLSADTSSKTTPTGAPAMRCNSCHSSRTTPVVAATTPSQLRPLMIAP